MSCLLSAGLLRANTGPIFVKANENTTISLFFPSPIVKVIEPASHFSFKHEPSANLATLKAKKGNPSNLTVITESGDIFSFALVYSETIQNFTYVISLEQAIGKRGAVKTQRKEVSQATNNAPEIATDISENTAMGTFRSEENQETQLQLTETNVANELEITDAGTFNATSDESFKEQGSFYDMDREGYYEIFCENSYLQRTITKNNMRDNNGVDLRLNHMAVDHDQIYFTLQFRNVSKGDYEIGNVRFYIQTLGNEELSMTPLYTYNLGGVIKQSGVNKFVYVFQDFKLGPNQKVYVLMNEEVGKRNIVLPLDMPELRKNLE